MYLKQHFVLTTLLAITLIPILKEKVLLLYLGGFLIDVDHYIEHIFSHKTLSIKHAYKFYMKKSKIILKQTKKGIPHRFKPYFHFFHTIEVYLILIILSFYSTYALIILIGLTFHQLLDLGDFIYNKIKYPILKYERCYSLIQYLYLTSCP